MGGAVGVIPEQIDEATCRQLLGTSYDDVQFKKCAVDGLLSKEQLEQRLSVRTDAFLTHDWGGADQANHIKVSKVNAMLQSMGVRTWFDEEQMQGNIKKQMVQGIDNANCVVVFITSRYVQKVASDNAGDNCQLEFNYASLQKTASKMVAVVMEPSMRDTKLWGGEVGMVLGGNLYVDMCGDLDDRDYLKTQCQELHDSIIQRTGKLLNTFLKDVGKDLNVKSKPSAVQSSPPPTAMKASDTRPAHGSTSATKPLHSLTIDDVGALLDVLNLSTFRAAVAANLVDGPCLEAVESSEDVKELGVSINAKAKVFFNKINDFRVHGVPVEMLATTNTTSPPQVTAYPVATAVGAGTRVGRVKHVVVHAGSYVDYTTFYYYDGNNRSAGKVGGSAQPPFELADDEYIKTVIYNHNKNELRKIQFITNHGRASPTYGGGGCSATDLTATAPDGQEVVHLTRASRFCASIERVVFGSLDPTKQAPVVSSIREVLVYAGSFVDYTVFTQRDGSQQKAGKMGGTAQAPFCLEDDEYISEVKVNHTSSELHLLELITSCGRRSQVFGGGKCTPESDMIFKAPSGYEIVGLQRPSVFCGMVDDIMIRKLGKTGEILLARSLLNNGQRIGKLQSVTVHAGSYVDYTTFTLYDGQQHTGGKIGGKQMSPFELAEGEYIQSIIHNHTQNQLRKVQFVTNIGRKSPVYGGGGCKGADAIQSAPDGHEIIGLVRASEFCGAIQDFIYNKL